MPEWASRLLKMLIYTALPVKRILSFYKPLVADLIFNSFLGDVHLYGDYPRTRGQAVRRFHVILDEIVIRDFIKWYKVDYQRMPTYHPPKFTVIAHSLGSIMSFDALVYSRAKEEVRKGEAQRCPSLPFPGYAEPSKDEEETWNRIMKQLKKLKKEDEERVKNHNCPRISQESQANLEEIKLLDYLCDSQGTTFKKFPPLMWRNYVKIFVTLGSPIDKFHVLWYQNYLHMGLDRPQSPGDSLKKKEFQEKFASWFDCEWLDDSSKSEIVHYNLCDEQDPVGHHLDVAKSSKVYP